VLHKDPNEWSERYYITFQDNPFIIPDEIKAARAYMHAHVARLFRDVWGKETRTFQYWYDLERKGYQGYLANQGLRTGPAELPLHPRGKTVLLCWKLGEKEIDFWHLPEDGFAGRIELGHSRKLVLSCD
jgi:hypothetical protein